MKNFYSIQLVVILLMIHLGLNAQSGTGTFTVVPQGIKVVGEKVFTSANPKTSEKVREPLRLNYSLVFRDFFKLEPGMHGITGTIDKPGGKITLEVFAYDPDEPDGIQRMTLSNGKEVLRVVYSCYIDKSTDVGKTPRTFQAQTTQVDYGYLRDANQPNRMTAYGKATSTDLKTLGAGSRNGFKTSTCVSSIWAGIHWLSSGLNANFWLNPDKKMAIYECADVAENYFGGAQPVIIRLTMKDATLEDFAVPAMSTNGTKTLIMEKKTIKRINKVLITILEPSTVNQTIDFYKEKIATTIEASNRYFTNTTGRIKPKEVLADIGRFGIAFKDIEIVIKKAQKPYYDYYDMDQLSALLIEMGYIQNSSQRRINIVYVVPKTGGGTSPLGSVTLHKKGIIGIQETSVIIHNFEHAFFPTTQAIIAFGPPSLFFTHEVGHYFGLAHPYEGGCHGGDNISDTPPCEGQHWYMDGRKLRPNACDNAPIQCGLRRQIENMMDYGACRWLFTKGQVDYMNRVLATAPDLYVTEQLDAGQELPTLTVKITDLRNAASGKVNFKTETVADHQGPIHEEEQYAIPSPYFTLYPNPTEGPLHLDYTMPRAGTGHLSIRDLMGKVVYQENLSFVAGSNSYSIEHLKLLPNTHYLLRFESEAMTRVLRFMSK